MLKHLDCGHINNDFYIAWLFFFYLCWKNINIIHNIQLLLQLRIMSYKLIKTVSLVKVFWTQAVGWKVAPPKTGSTKSEIIEITINC